MEQENDEWAENTAFFDEKFWQTAAANGYPKSVDSGAFLGAVFMHQALSALRSVDGIDIDDGETIAAYKSAINSRRYGKIEYILGGSLTFAASAEQHSGAKKVTEFAAAWRLLGMAEGQTSAILIDPSLIGKLLGRKGANAAHEETRKLKKEVLDYWRENIKHSLSNEKAAELLKKQFPLSHRKLAEYVAEEKKAIRAAAKA